MQTKKLKIIPLGGLGEFGMNCLALRWEDDIIVIDAGLMFPESELLGVDIVVPDITYLIENKQHVRAIVLTHGHEDHIGGLPWILSELKVPVYATEFTLAYVEGKLEEHELLDETELIEIAPKEKFTIGPFTIEPIRVTHSLVDCVALAVETPVGVVIHTGDFKIDLSPLDDKAFDLHTFAEYGKRGVLALLQDSTNVERSGYTPSERAVIPRLDEIFSRTKKKLFFTCFSSSIYRMRIAMELARAHGRKVAIVGRSMMESTEIAQDLGYIDIPPGLVIQPGQMRDYPPEQLMILISGTQGEPMSALSRAAVDNHKHARIDPGDTVVLSSQNYSRQREEHLPRHRPSLPPRRQRDLRRWRQRPDSRQRPRLPGRDAPAHQPGAAQVLYSRARRLSQPAQACAGGHGNRRGGARHRD